MTWSFPGIVSPVELTYTQTLGFQPDVILVRANPQVTNIPTYGTVTMNWDFTTLTLSNCVVDLASLRLTSDGQYITLKIFDRRELWSRAAPISGEYNVIRGGEYVTAKKKNLRQLGTMLMTALGETTADVSALPTNIYPAVSWECEDVIEAAEALFSEYGFSVALGFGSEAVKIVTLGTGATLSTVDMYVGSSTIDPKLSPRWLRNCFKPSVAQVRLKMEAIGLDTDGEWRPIDDMTSKPAGGWGQTPPYSLSRAHTDLTPEQEVEHRAYIRRAYRPMGFADGTWNFPDGSGSVPALDYILPLQNRLLEPEALRLDLAYAPFRVYGRYTYTPTEKAQPGGVVQADITTEKGDRVVGMEYHLDGETGLLLFDEPMYVVNGSDYEAAELYLEVTIQVRDTTNFSWQHYEYDVDMNPQGVGFYTVRHDLRAETIVQYDEEQAVTSFTNNQAALNALGDATALASVGAFLTSASQHIVYNKPKLALRCDGAIMQVQHILTCGDNEQPVNRTTASRNFEFDRGIPKRVQRAAHLRAMYAGANVMREKTFRSRRESRDD